jgi:hypothetical protein
MKKLSIKLFTIIFIFNYSIGYGQTNMEDVVYLKNGSIIRGIIIEQIPNQSLKIQTADRNVFVFKIEEVEKMTKENLPSNPIVVDEYKKKGYINITEINFCPGVTGSKINEVKVQNQDLSFGFKTVNGYQANEHFSIGLGLGIDKYQNATLLPITLDMRVPVVKGKSSPVFNFAIGHAAGLNDVKGGLTTNFSFGLRSYFSKSAAFLFNIGYKLQSTEISYYNYTNYNVVYQNGFPIYYSPSLLTEKVTFGFLSVNLGFSF